MASPAIACIGIIGKYDNPLHIALFPPHEDEELDMSFLLNTSLDIFDLRRRQKTLEQDLGLLQAVDERLATYGWLTNTGVKFIIVVDMEGRPPALPVAAEEGSNNSSSSGKKKAVVATPQPIVGLRDAELKPAFKAIHKAYIQLLLNPFYTPEDQTPLQLANNYGRISEITSKRFIADIQRIGISWSVGVTSL